MRGRKEESPESWEAKVQSLQLIYNYYRQLTLHYTKQKVITPIITAENETVPPVLQPRAPFVFVDPVGAGDDCVTISDIVAVGKIPPPTNV
jgi:hypothetical protein